MCSKLFVLFSNFASSMQLVVDPQRTATISFHDMVFRQSANLPPLAQSKTLDHEYIIWVVTYCSVLLKAGTPTKALDLLLAANAHSSKHSRSGIACLSG